MQDKDIDKIVTLIMERLEENINGIENTNEFKELMRSKNTKTIRILSSVKEILVTHCEYRLLTPVQYASRAIIKQVFRDKKRENINKTKK